MTVRIEEYAGPHRDLVDSFREAEDSELLLAAYLELGRVWVARDEDGAVLGHLQVVPEDEGATWEVTPMRHGPRAPSGSCSRPPRPTPAHCATTSGAGSG